jgi:hypothetical protein
MVKISSTTFSDSMRILLCVGAMPNTSIHNRCKAGRSVWPMATCCSPRMRNGRGAVVASLLLLVLVLVLRVMVVVVLPVEDKQKRGDGKKNAAFRLLLFSHSGPLCHQAARTVLAKGVCSMAVVCRNEKLRPSSTLGMMMLRVCHSRSRWRRFAYFCCRR